MRIPSEDNHRSAQKGTLSSWQSDLLPDQSKDILPLQSARATISSCQA